MIKIKRLTFKYLIETKEYVVIKVVNVKGFKPGDVLSEVELNKLYSTEIEVVIK